MAFKSTFVKRDISITKYSIIKRTVIKIRKYKIVLEFIKFIEFYPLLWMRKNKEAPSTEILEKIKEYQY